MSHQTTGDPRAQFLGFDTTGNVQARLQGEEERAESIALIKEIVPGYGDGFIGACLAACGGDSQRTTNMLLEGKFPQQLDVLDRQTGKAPGYMGLASCTTSAWVLSASHCSELFYPFKVPASVRQSGGERATTETGDPRATWMRSGAAVDPPVHGGAPDAAAHKDQPKNGDPEPHIAHGVSQFGDLRAAWVHSGADTTAGPPTHHPAPPAEDEEGRFLKTGDPRAQ
ncbi:hypothetical protein COCOBI_12-5290 [Coccomyxa sp. Obi]|nr:hypothetical protein COCOBI_12-5290 [Coccomyxa sp. Obi]